MRGPVTPSADKALPGLARALGVALPDARAFSAASGLGEPGGHVPSAGVSGPLREPEPVTLRVVGKADAGRWRAMMERHHPRGCPQAPGAVLRYWIVSGRCGCIGGIGFRAAGRHVRARDEWIGCSNAAKAASPGLPVNNHRFLPLPGVAVPSPASHVPDRVGRCLPDDREARHGQRPQVACTCVDEPGAGSCRRAANRHFAGMTAARARSGGAKPQCGIFMRPLERGWRQRMAEVPRRSVGTLADSRVDGGDGTGDGEFAYPAHCDGRVRRRPPRVGDRRASETRGSGMPAARFGGCSRIPPTKRRVAVLCRTRMSPCGMSRSPVWRARWGAAAPIAVFRRCGTRQCPPVPAWPGAPKAWPRPTGGGKGSVGIAAHAMLALLPGGRPPGVLSVDADFRGKHPCSLSRPFFGKNRGCFRVFHELSPSWPQGCPQVAPPAGNRRGGPPGRPNRFSRPGDFPGPAFRRWPGRDPPGNAVRGAVCSPGPRAFA